MILSPCINSTMQLFIENVYKLKLKKIVVTMPTNNIQEGVVLQVKSTFIRHSHTITYIV